MFHALFSKRNNEITEELISDILNEKVEITEYLDRHIVLKKPEDKFSILDLKVKLSSGTYCNVEVQVDKLNGDIKRFLFYLCHIYIDQLKKKEKYSALKRVVSVVFVDYEIPLLKNLEILGITFEMRDSLTGKIVLTDDFKLCIIEIPKALRLYKKGVRNDLIYWTLFINNPNDEEVKNIMEKSAKIRNAYNILSFMSGSLDLRARAAMREKAIRDKYSLLETSHEEGFKEGKEAGIQEGIKEGIVEEKERVVTNMYKKGIDISVIMDVTNLKKEEIEGIIARK